MKRLALLPIAATLAAALATPAGAQTETPWYPLDASPPGTPASVSIGRDSDGSHTTLILVMHGFYGEPKTDPSGMPYLKITVPGLGTFAPTGAPDLPGLQVPIALPPGVTGAHVGQIDAAPPMEFPGTMVWPRVIPEKDDSTGTPEQFVRDDGIYALPAPWPPADADAGAPASPLLGSIQGSRVALYPFHWNPSTQVLDVTPSITVRFDHDGTPSVASPTTPRREKVAVSLFPNWGEVSQYYPINLTKYDGQYLIILPTGWQWAVQPLIDQKHARGLWVTLDFVPTTGNTCESIRALIQNWYNATPPEQDHYCLLVGEPDVIPFCSAPITGGPPTDDLYASVNGDDLDEEVYLGRLSAPNDASLAPEVQKIVDYMDSPPITDAFKTALLVAHLQDAPGKYEGAQESVRTASYSDPPNFVTIYGSNPLVTNNNVTVAINAGCGLVAYRGHGSSNAWAAWANAYNWYTTGNVSGLANGHVTPVVWNFACSNHDLSFTQSLGETWMYTSARAVSSYGATVASWTEQNHELDRQMFKAVYDLGLVTQSMAIQYAEAEMALLKGSDNAWFYDLLGDPEMPIRRERPLAPWAIYHPSSVTPCGDGSCTIGFHVTDAAGAPVPNLQVSLWKPPNPNAPQSATGGTGSAVAASGTDEVLDNRYTDGNGDANVPAAPQTTGWIRFTVQDDAGNEMLDSIQVVNPTAVQPSADAAPRLTAAPSIARGWTRFGFGAPLASDARVTLFDVAGRAVRALRVKAGEDGVPWATDDDAGRALPTGLYLARLTCGRRVATARVMVVR